KGHGWTLRSSVVCNFTHVLLDRPGANNCDSSGSGLARGADAFDRTMGSTPGEVIRGLGIDPELRRRSESRGEEPCRLRSDAALARDNLVDALDRHAHVASEGYLRQTQGAKKFLEQDFPGVGRDSVL